MKLFKSKSFFKPLLLTMVCFVMVGFLFFSVGQVLADDYGTDLTADAAGLSSYGTDFTGMIGNIIGSILAFVGVAFFGLTIYGGMLWMLSRGNQEQEKKALDTITGAIVGVAIVLAAFAITRFVFSSLQDGKTPGSSVGEKAQCADVHKGWGCTNIKSCLSNDAKVQDVQTKTTKELRIDCSSSFICKLDVCPGSEDYVICCDLGAVDPETL